MELIAIVRELEPRLLQALSGISVEFVGKAAIATLSINLMLPSGFSSKVGPYNIEVDKDSLPEGVSFAGIQRFPDIKKVLSIETPIEELIWTLGESNIVGGLDVIRIEGGAEAIEKGVPPVNWIIKTHWANMQERIDWIRSLIITDHL